ncbi:hypothetical protein K438DRAFT_1756575 [Mycena galopus ATCC 62051]|nr:hypothetical protein K438DRAFT_1756575 [Mycena galopus ATCC 62051]
MRVREQGLENAIPQMLPELQPEQRKPGLVSGLESHAQTRYCVAAHIAPLTWVTAAWSSGRREVQNTQPVSSGTASTWRMEGADDGTLGSRPIGSERSQCLRDVEFRNPHGEGPRYSSLQNLGNRQRRRRSRIQEFVWVPAVLGNKFQDTLQGKTSRNCRKVARIKVRNTKKRCTHPVQRSHPVVARGVQHKEGKGLKVCQFSGTLQEGNMLQRSGEQAVQESLVTRRPGHPNSVAVQAEEGALHAQLANKCQTGVSGRGGICTTKKKRDRRVSAKSRDLNPSPASKLGGGLGTPGTFYPDRRTEVRGGSVDAVVQVPLIGTALRVLYPEEETGQIDNMTGGERSRKCHSATPKYCTQVAGGAPAEGGVWGIQKEAQA